MPEQPPEGYTFQVRNGKRCLVSLPPAIFKKSCVVCGTEFMAKDTRAKYCSPRCLRKFHYDKKRASMPQKERKAEGCRKPNCGYTLGELLYRPFPHILEALTSKQLAEAWGINKDTASHIKARPWEYTDTSNELNDKREMEAREWIRKQIA